MLPTCLCWLWTSVRIFWQMPVISVLRTSSIAPWSLVNDSKCCWAPSSCSAAHLARSPVSKINCLNMWDTLDPLLGLLSRSWIIEWMTLSQTFLPDPTLCFPLICLERASSSLLYLFSISALFLSRSMTSPTWSSSLSLIIISLVTHQHQWSYLLLLNLQSIIQDCQLCLHPRSQLYNKTH